jgi:DNA-binding response OmpR family regulator
MSQKVLVVEPDPTLLNNLYYNLSLQAYQVITASNGYSCLESVRAERPDLIIIDLVLPDLDGEEVYRIIQQETIAPVLLVTEQPKKIGNTVSLDTWCDDFVAKPFSMRDFLHRVKVLLRRASYMREELAPPSAQQNQIKLDLGDLVINQMRCEVTLNGQPLHLKPKEYDLLLFLALNRGMALSRDLILERVWGWDYAGAVRTVDVHVCWLREKIEDNPTIPSRIATVRGVGYRFEA